MYYLWCAIMLEHLNQIRQVAVCTSKPQPQPYYYSLTPIKFLLHYYWAGIKHF